MKTKKLLVFAASLLLFSSIKAQTEVLLYDFETETTQAGTYTLQWSGAPYIKAFDVINNPTSSGINTSAKVLRIQEEGELQWWNNTVVYNLTSPVTISSANRYLHIKHLRPRITGGGFIVSLNAANATNGMASGANRFDANLSAINEWQDIVIDLNTLITNNVPLSNVNICIDINDWGSSLAPLGDYLFDDIVLSNSPLPRGTTFLTGNNLYDFETATSGNITGVSTHSDAGNPVTYPVSNPFQTTTNPSLNVGHRSAISSINWWVGMEFSFVNPVQVNETHKYLHVMLTTPIDAQKVTFDVKQGATKVISDQVKTITTANTWQDIVIDVSAMAYISGMAIKCGNWDGTAAGDYYFDNIYIDDNPNPRVNIATDVKSTELFKQVYANGKNIVVNNNTDKPMLVEIYNAAGQKIESKIISQKNIFELHETGLYFVNAGGTAYKVILK